MEKIYKPVSGYLALVVILALIIFPVLGLIIHVKLWVIPILVVSLCCVIGFVVVNPNESSVLILFGNYKGTIKKNGFFWVNPFFVRKKISLRARNIDSEPIKVNDKIGNPIMIGIVLVWKVENTYKAAFEVDDYSHFVNIQSEAAIRKLAGHYPYDNFDDEGVEITLRSGGEEVNHVLEAELTERLTIAGIKVLEARIAYLAYALRIDPEILGAIEKWAADEFRSVNGQIEWMLANMLKGKGRYPKKNPLRKTNNHNSVEPYKLVPEYPRKNIYFKSYLSFMDFVRKTRIAAKFKIATTPRIRARRNQSSPFSILMRA